MENKEDKWAPWFTSDFCLATVQEKETQAEFSDLLELRKQIQESGKAKTLSSFILQLIISLTIFLVFFISVFHFE